MTQVQTYQTILHQLSQIPASRMAEVQRFLEKMVQKEPFRQSYAGSWSDFSDEDFEDFQQVLKKNRDQMNQEFDERSNR